MPSVWPGGRIASVELYVPKVNNGILDVRHFQVAESQGMETQGMTWGKELQSESEELLI